MGPSYCASCRALPLTFHGAGLLQTLGRGEASLVSCPYRTQHPRAPPEAPSPQRHHVAAYGQTHPVRSSGFRGPHPEANADLRSSQGQQLIPLGTLPSCCYRLPFWGPGAENEDIKTLQNYRDECKDRVLEFTGKHSLKSWVHKEPAVRLWPHHLTSLNLEKGDGNISLHRIV